MELTKDRLFFYKPVVKIQRGEWILRFNSIAASLVSVFALSSSVYAQSILPVLPSNEVAGPAIQLVQSNNATTGTSQATKLNANTVSIITGNPNGTYLYLAYDMTAVLDDGDNLRVLPIIGKGGAQNTKDILYLKGVDMGITQSVILSYYNKTGEVGRNIANRLRYITRLHQEELHLLVTPDINSIEDLAGKKVNFNNPRSGTDLSCTLIFDLLNIPVDKVNMGQADAFEAMRRGELSATINMAGKPTAAFGKLKADPSKYKMLSFPYSPKLQDDFLPAFLTHEDYPELIAEGEKIETIAASAVLVVFNWNQESDRYRRVAKFTKALFNNFDKFLKKPRHKKWKEVNLAAKLPGWTRFAAAEELLNTVSASNSVESRDRLRTNFKRFLSTQPNAGGELSNEQHDRLFREFLEWQGMQ